MKTGITYLLFPFAWLYGMVLNFRHKLYSSGIYKRITFEIPTIAIGNLSVGGTGKTPMVEYLLRLLHGQSPAVVSRGYRRETSGFRLARKNDTWRELGDEPAQLNRNFPKATIAVDANRALAIPQVLMTRPETGVILLDDAMQHLPVKAGLNILLTTYRKPFFKDHLLPVGTLRDLKSVARQADIIVVTKCPDNLFEKERQHFMTALKKYRAEKVLFATEKYGRPYELFTGKNQELTDVDEALAVTGIAWHNGFETYIQQHVRNVETIHYPDHHRYSETDLQKMLRRFAANEGKRWLITTEKDAMRLQEFEHWFSKENITVICQPVEMQFLEGKNEFDKLIKAFLDENKQTGNGADA